MDKKIVIAILLLLLAVFSIVESYAVSAAAEKDVAYITTNPSLSSNILSTFSDLELSYDLIRNADIPSTDFSKYSMLVVETDVGNRDLIPFESKHAIFLNERIAQEVWAGSDAGSTSAREIKVLISSHEIFSGVSVPADGVIQIYSPASETHRLRVKPYYVQSLAILTTANMPVIATSTREISGAPIKDIFFGFPITNNWNANAKTIFSNSLEWLLTGVDQDGDGFVFEDDCNDKNDTIYPDAPETAYDFIDQDCDGYDLLDSDGDGYCAQGYIIQNALFQCINDLGKLTGTDCDDDDLEINNGNPDPYLNCVNDAPEITEIPSVISAKEGEIVEFEVTAEDPEGEDLIYEINDDRFTVDENSFIWQTEYSDSGTYFVEVSVSDGEFAVKGIVEIRVSNENQPPEFYEIPELVFDEDDSLTLDISLYAHDFDDDGLQFGVEELSDEENIIVSFVDDVTVKIEATPDFYGEASIWFYVDDGLSKTVSDEVRIVVNSVDDAVEFEGEIPEQSWAEDTSHENAINLNGYFKDVDSELEFFVTGNELIEIVIDEGVVSFYSPDDFYGTEEVYFTATDGESSVVSNFVKLVVNEMGEVPVLGEFICETTINEDEVNSCELEAFDFENNELTFSVSAQEDALCDVEGNVLTYKGEKDYNGAASCTIVVTDIHGSDSGILELDVLPVNDAPEILSYSPTENLVKIILGDSRLFSVKTRDIDSSTETVWLLDEIEKENSAESESEFNFDGLEIGTYNLEARVSDEEYAKSRFWQIVVGEMSEFTCAEVGGNICSAKQSCESDYLGVMDSKTCCATVCIPAFDDADSCEIVDSKISVEIKSPDADEEIEIGETMTVEVSVKNNLEEEADLDVEVHLYNLKRDKSEFDDDASLELKPGRARTVKFKIEIPGDLEPEDEYAIYVKASDKSCNQAYRVLNLKRPESKLAITKLELPNSIQCGELLEGKIRVENVGESNEDAVISVKNRKLGLSFDSGEFRINNAGESDDRRTETFFQLIPENIEGGEYVIEAVVTYDSSEREVLTQTIEVFCEEEIVAGAEIQPENLDNSISLNNVESLNGSKLNSSGEKMKIVFLMMLNIFLVCSAGALYFLKKSGKN